LHTESEGKIIYEKVPTLRGNYYDFFDGVYKSITHNTLEPVTAQDGVNVMQIIEAAIHSSEQKKAIYL
jgi:predicted dehydrogenase